MRFICRYENSRTGERKEQVCTLDADEIAQVERVRKIEGDEIAGVTAAAIVLRSAYRDLDAHVWRHLEPPALIRPS
jgi:hypothetical protein